MRQLNPAEAGADLALSGSFVIHADCYAAANDSPSDANEAKCTASSRQCQEARRRSRSRAGRHWAIAHDRFSLNIASRKRAIEMYKK